MDCRLGLQAKVHGLKHEAAHAKRPVDATQLFEKLIAEVAPSRRGWLGAMPWNATFEEIRALPRGMSR